MGKGNPNPVHRLSREELVLGAKAGAAKRKQLALERQLWEQTFTEAARDILSVEAYELRKRLVARLCAEALKGKPWAMELCMGYLYGKPRQDVLLGTPAEMPFRVVLHCHDSD